MSEGPLLERLLKRDRAITLAGVAALCALAWLYIATGAGLGMGMGDATSWALFPHRQAADVGGMAMAPVTEASGPPAWGVAYWALIIAMWWIMMIAMMAPSAAPT